MSKKYTTFITVLFCLFIFGFGLALLILPDREFSEQENRYLTQFEAPTLDSVFGENGQFMADFEKYVNDQFPLRDQWIQLKAWSERLSGKQENNKVYFGGEGQQTLFAQYTKPSDLEQRVDYVNQLGANVDVPVYFALIPDKTWVWADRLPAGAPLVDDGSTIRDAQGLVSEDVTFIDLTDALQGDDVFYDIVCEGSAKTLVWQPADLGAYLHIVNGERYLGFTPTMNYNAKSAYGIKGLVKVPELKDGEPNDFLTKLFAKVKENIAAESASLAPQKEAYEEAIAAGKLAIETIQKPEDVTEAMSAIKSLPHALTSERELKAALTERLKELRIVYNKGNKAYEWAQ